MNPRISRRSLVLAVVVSGASIFAQSANATIVEFQTVMGKIEVNLYDNATPETVANFLEYVNNMAYSDSVIHRSIPDFVIQGGGFSFDDLTKAISAIPQNASVVNEPVFSNVVGTISMAKLANQPNSATNQWFFNMANNSANLDPQNGGFSVFGEVIGNGMDVLDAIAAVTAFDATAVLPSAFTNVPLRGDVNNDPLDETNFIIITDIIITDSMVDTAGIAGLNPTPNTLINPPPASPPTNSGGGGGGGSLGFLALFGLLLGYRFRQA